MIYMLAEPPLLPDGWEHIATDWQIAEDDNMENLVVESMNDSTNKLIKIFNNNLDPKKLYYGRSRIIFNKAIGEWSDIKIIRPRDIDKLYLTNDIPIQVDPPKVTITGLEGATSLFTIEVTPIGSNGNSKHIATSYNIRDINGFNIYSDIYNTDELTQKHIDSIVLKPNSFYIIDVCIHTASNDISEFTHVNYVTAPDNIGEVKSKTYGLTKKENVTIELPTVDNVEQITYELYRADIGKEPLLLDSSIDNTFVKIYNKDLFNSDSEYYICKVNVKYKNKTEDNKFIPLVFVN